MSKSRALSPEVAVYHRWYGTRRWRRRALRHLRDNPFCVMCLRAGGVYTAATVADHIRPHRGDPVAFWTGKLQSLCPPHHGADKQREELLSRPLAVDLDGWPIERADPPPAH